MENENDTLMVTESKAELIKSIAIVLEKEFSTEDLIDVCNDKLKHIIGSINYE